MRKSENSTLPKTSVILTFLTTLVQPLFFAAVILLFIHVHKNKDYIPDVVLHLLTLALFFAILLYVTLKRLSATDRLTRLPTQKTFMQQVAIKFFTKRLPKYTALFINLKGFRYINRMVGSTNGDVILYKYSLELRHNLKKGELIGRLGGDNFVILIRTKRLGGFLQLIQKIDITIKMNGIDKTIPVCAYCGIYELTEKDGIHEVLAKPSDALNYLKARGMDNYLFYSEEIANEIYKEKQISYQFNTAIEKHEFKVYYQPKINLKTNKLIGCEALVRWQQHDGKIVPPDEFIPVLEKTGLIKILDFYVMEQVCRDINSWKKKGINCVPIATNFSKIHIQDLEFPETIIEILDKNNTDRNLFEVELTESSNYEGYENLIRFLEIMRQNKISTAIDDFGIGYSSLSLLKNESVKIVKIDKSFIDDIEENSGKNEHTLLVQSIVQICHALNKEVICEGIENENQKAILEKMDCLIIQGFLYDKPLTYEEFENRLRNPEY